MGKLRTGIIGLHAAPPSNNRNWHANWRSWDLPQSAPALRKGQVHLWLVDRERFSRQDFSHTMTISHQERERASIYRFQRDRDRYLVSRLCLRNLLSGYLQVRPAEVTLTQGFAGKPQLGPPTQTDIQFNLTHADNFTLIALTRGAAIGVDLEAAEPQPGYKELSRHILSPPEQADFNVLPVHARHNRFYRLWTMKEAILKAFGTGFRQDPRQLNIGIELTPIAVRQLDIQGQHGRLWTLIQLPLIEGYISALALRGVGWTLQCWKMDGPLQD